MSQGPGPLNSLLCALQHHMGLFSDQGSVYIKKYQHSNLNGLSYSRFMYGLKLAGVDMNRKMLAEMAVNDAEGFKTLAELAKSFASFNTLLCFFLAFMPPLILAMFFFLLNQTHL